MIVRKKCDRKHLFIQFLVRTKTISSTHLPFFHSTNTIKRNALLTKDPYLGEMRFTMGSVRISFLIFRATKCHVSLHTSRKSAAVRSCGKLVCGCIVAPSRERLIPDEKTWNMMEIPNPYVDIHLFSQFAWLNFPAFSCFISPVDAKSLGTIPATVLRRTPLSDDAAII